MKKNNSSESNLLKELGFEKTLFFLKSKKYELEEDFSILQQIKLFKENNLSKHSVMSTMFTGYSCYKRMIDVLREER